MVEVARRNTGTAIAYLLFYTFSLTDWRVSYVYAFTQAQTREECTVYPVADEAERDIAYDPKPIGRYSVAPGTKVLLLPVNATNAASGSVFWDLRGWWDKPPLINARVETAATSRMFKPLWQHGRAIVFADGWFGVEEGRRQKQPYFIRSGLTASQYS